jgi:hypothetical protein
MWGSAGVEEGRISHKPSTQDLLAQVPMERLVDTCAWRQRASSVGGSLVGGLERLAGKDMDGAVDSPRWRAAEDHSGAISQFASGSLDVEVRKCFLALAYWSERRQTA